MKNVLNAINDVLNACAEILYINLKTDSRSSELQMLLPTVILFRNYTHLCIPYQYTIRSQEIAGEPEYMYSKLSLLYVSNGTTHTRNYSN